MNNRLQLVLAEKKMTKIQEEFFLTALTMGINGKAHSWNTHHMSYPLIHNSNKCPQRK